MKKDNSILLLILAIMLAFAGIGHAQQPNILFIAVDDLNCDIGAYGNRMVKSPNIDRLASEGVLFTNNHCQQPVCGASRASILSGFTPEHTGVTSFYIYMRDLYPDMITLPQFFKNKGYNTVGMGKIFDPRNVSETDGVDLPSWSNWINITGDRWIISSGNPVTEMADFEDEVYTDGKIANEGVRQIRSLASGEDPFFLAVGFKKPHLPFVAPKKYWDLYDRDSIPLAPYRRYAEDDVEFVHNQGNEFLNGYDGVPELGTWTYSLQREYIHAYYACVSFIDAQVGKLINELKTQGVYDNTIIVFWGDHGFSLGDHTNWGKHTNFEYATRSPMIFRVPGMTSGSVNQSPTEFLDIYPSLVDLAGFEVPDTLDGSSLLPVLSGEQDRIKSFAVSQYRRGGLQGFVLRSDHYQYVEWSSNGQVEHRQLFNFAADPYQTVNLAMKADYLEIVDSFSFHLNRYLEQGVNSGTMDFVADTDSLGLYGKQTNLAFSIAGEEADIIPMGDALIRMASLELPTGPGGYTALNLQPGSYSYTIEKKDYWPTSGTIELFGKDTLVMDTLHRRYFYLSVNVIDSAKQVPLSGMELSLNGQSEVTDSEGMARFRVEAGAYELKLSSEIYGDQQMIIDVEADTMVRLALRPIVAYVKFKLFEEGVPIKDALVELNQEVQLSNAIGMARYENLGTDVEYQYSVSKEGYQDLEGAFILHADTTIELEMLPLVNSREERHSYDQFIYPNPASESLYFRSVEQESELCILDITGSERMKLKVRESGSLDLSALPEGLYILRLSQGPVILLTEKLIIER